MINEQTETTTAPLTTAAPAWPIALAGQRGAVPVVVRYRAFDVH